MNFEDLEGLTAHHRTMQETEILLLEDAFLVTGVVCLTNALFLSFLPLLAGPVDVYPKFIVGLGF